MEKMIYRDRENSFPQDFQFLNYRRDIDGLRAVAVVPVILFHAGFSVFSGGYVGVDVFFVISGYLITSIIVAELEESKFSILRFYERRARRILPALFFVMLSCIPFAWMWMLPSQFKDFSQSIVAVSLFASNILFWRESGYFAPAAEEKPLLHTWSLAVEEQFYVFFPIALVLLWRFGRNPVFYCIVAISVISFLLTEWGWRNAPTANFYLAPTRAWELLAGSICAFIQFGKPQKSSNALSAFGLALIFYSVFYYDHSTPFPSAYALAPVVGTVLIILFGAHETWVARLLAQKVFVGVGLISYSAYLWHQPLFAFARIRHIDAPPQWLMFTLAVTSIGLAYFSWRFVEQPFRKPSIPVFASQKAVFRWSGAVGVIFLALGLAGHSSDGNLVAMSDLQKAYLSTATISPMRQKCHVIGANRIEPENACEFFDENVSVAVFGDSHTVELSSGLAEAFASSGIGIKQFSHSDCPPIYELANFTHACSEWKQQAIEYIENNSGITHVIVSYRITSHINRLEHLSARQKLTNDLSTILARLSEKKTVIYVMQAPELRAPISKLIRLDDLAKAPEIVSLSVSDWMDMRSEFDTLFAPHLKDFAYYDPMLDLCDQEQCFAARNGTSYYFDDDHLSIAGVAQFAENIVSMVVNTN